MKLDLSNCHILWFGALVFEVKSKWNFGRVFVPIVDFSDWLNVFNKLHMIQGGNIEKKQWKKNNNDVE